MEVTSETHDMEDRFNYYRQGSKYRLFYNGNSLYTQWFIVAGPGIYICAIPFIEGYVEDDDCLISVDKKNAGCSGRKKCNLKLRRVIAIGYNPSFFLGIIHGHFAQI